MTGSNTTPNKGKATTKLESTFKCVVEHALAQIVEDHALAGVLGPACGLHDAFRVLREPIVRPAQQSPKHVNTLLCTNLTMHLELR